MTAGIQPFLTAVNTLLVDAGGELPNDVFAELLARRDDRVVILAE